MIKFILIYVYHDIHVEYFKDSEELRERFLQLHNEYRNDNDFDCKMYKISSRVDFC